MSIQDDLAKASARVQRDLFDHKIQMTGRQVLASRFSVETQDIYGDETSKLIRKNQVTAIVNFPDDEIPLTRFRSDGIAQVEQTGTFLMDIIPIDIFVRFQDVVEKGDFLFFMLKDENGSKLGILLQISNVVGSFSTELVWKKCYAAIHNGEVIPELQSEIAYLLEKDFQDD